MSDIYRISLSPPMDTSYPERALALKNAGLDRVTISLDSLKRDVFKQMTGVDVLDKVLDGIAGCKISCTSTDKDHRGELFAVTMKMKWPTSPRSPVNMTSRCAS
jgi:MoaA/NifB/PqqE/SkfB family radical SAM enzyme